MAPFELDLDVLDSIIQAYGEAGSGDTIRYLPVSNPYSDRTIYCVLDHAILSKANRPEPFAQTPEQAKNKLSSWIGERLVASKATKAVETPTASVTPFAETEEVAKQKLSTWLEKQELGRELNRSRPSEQTQTTTLADPKTEAVELLTRLGYAVTPPARRSFETRSPDLTDVTPPPAYEPRPSSQPIRSVEKQTAQGTFTCCQCRKDSRTPTPGWSTLKRKRSSITTKRTATTPSRIPLASTEVAGSEADDEEDGGEDEDEAASRVRRSAGGNDARGQDKGDGTRGNSESEEDNSDDETTLPPRKKSRKVPPARTAPRKHQTLKQSVLSRFVKTKKSAQYGTITEEAMAAMGIEPRTRAAPSGAVAGAEGWAEAEAGDKTDEEVQGGDTEEDGAEDQVLDTNTVSNPTISALTESAAHAGDIAAAGHEAQDQGQYVLASTGCKADVIQDQTRLPKVLPKS